jgi:predicted nuclease with RNAse H fold
MTVIGIDLRSVSNRTSTALGLDEEKTVVSWDKFGETSELLDLVAQQKPSLIAIGSPLTLPSGLCCLDSECECSLESPYAKGRNCELELSRIGIGCFFTNKWSIVRDLINRGVKIKRHLNEMGFKVIEVYPYATKVLLFGDRLPGKKSGEYLDRLNQRVTSLMHGFQNREGGLDQNTCNAALNAYTGHLYLNGCTDSLGDSTEGMLVIPNLPR